MSVIRKVWGNCHKISRLDNTEIDLLYLEKNSACSVHHHKEKINRFILISGRVTINSDLGAYTLQLNEPFDVDPNIKHQFVAFEDSVMIEIAYVKDGKIDNKDIVRDVQGGKFIDGEFKTLDELRDNNWLGL